MNTREGDFSSIDSTVLTPPSWWEFVKPNISDAELLRKAQQNPEKYKDLIVRLWGVSAHFVDLPRELQDEMIARFS